MANATASPSVCRCRLHTCHAAGTRRPRPWEAQPRGPASLPQTVALSSGSTPELLVQPHVTRPLSAAGTPAGKGGPTVACSFCPPGPPFCFQTETRPPASLEGGPRERFAPSSGLAHSALGWAGIPPVYAAGDGLLPELPAPSLYPFGSAVKTGWRWGEHGDRNSACVRVWLPFYPELQ